MSKYLLIRKGTTELMDCADFKVALAAVGLEQGRVDFGTLTMRPVCLTVVVYEFGLLEPPEQHHFFSIGNGLFAGNAVVYQCNEEGETVDITHVPPVLHYRDCVEAERAVVAGQVRRPETAVNGRVMWQWRGA